MALFGDGLQMSTVVQYMIYEVNHLLNCDMKLSEAMIVAVMNAINQININYDSFHISFPTMKVASYFKLMLLGTYTIIVFECRTNSSLKRPPLMIKINLLVLDGVKSISIILSLGGRGCGSSDFLVCFTLSSGLFSPW